MHLTVKTREKSIDDLGDRNLPLGALDKLILQLANKGEVSQLRPVLKLLILRPLKWPQIFLFPK